MSQQRPLVYRITINTFLFFTSLLFCLLLAELGFRALEKKQIIPPYGIKQQSFGFGLGEHQAKLVPSKNPLLHVENDTNYPGINQHGMRDRNYSFQKPKNVFRIAAIGDSVTYGLGVPLPATFAKQLQTLANQADNNIRYQVLNFGVNAYDTIAEIEMIRSKALKFEPDLILVTYILNDTMRPQSMTESFKRRMKEAIKQKQAEKQSPPLLHSLAWVKHLFSQALRDRMSTQLYRNGYQGENWQAVEQSFDELADIAQQVPTVVFIFPLIQDWSDYKFKKEQQKVQQSLEERNINVLDLTDLLVEQDDYTSFLLRDNDHTHPNKTGHKRMAELMLRYLQQQQLLPAAD